MTDSIQQGFGWCLHDNTGDGSVSIWADGSLRAAKWASETASETAEQ